MTSRTGIRIATACIVALSALLQCAVNGNAQSPAKSAKIRFREISREAGLDTSPPLRLQKKYLVEMMGGGVALFDCDNDGRLDIVSVNDSDVDRYRSGLDLMVTLYHQDSALQFADVTRKAGLITKGWGMGIAIADYDNDGLADIYVTGYGHNVLYHNLGGCKFEDVTEKAHVSAAGFRW